jgi:hypothetical protein
MALLRGGVAAYSWPAAPARGIFPKGGSKVTHKQRFLFVLLLLATIGPALAQTRGGMVTIRSAYISPLIALLAGIVILIIPRVLNFVVAIYLILIGLIGLFGV